ncbi:MAG: glycosyl hydrolase family 28-related protein [Leptolyngbyaceae cyanobacterium bins.349]|nr:glycosyl hydrolase family 28-related protein [Leptolyngbyaceae cyanobacterium bins.349]
MPAKVLLQFDRHVPLLLGLVFAKIVVLGIAMSTDTATKLLDTTISLINGTLTPPLLDPTSRNNFVNLIFSSFNGSSAPSFTDLGGTVYFTADDRIHGRELWRSDGTIAGTTLVKDINPGLADAGPANFVVLGDTLYFTADDGVNGFELWKSDGTATGTTLVKDINLGKGSSTLSQFAIANGILYFSANDGIHGVELWKSDGTPAGTVLVRDIHPGPASASPTGLTALNGTLYFSANNGVTGAELWKSDGTATGTILVKDIQSGSANSFPINLTALGDRLYFSASDGVNGVELWRSDGTANGTVLVKDVNLGSANSFPTNLINWNNTLYFTADSGQGRNLWQSDGTATGTVLVDNTNPSRVGAYPDHLTSLNGMLYFTTYDVANGAALWRSDGTAAGTALVRSLDSSPNAANLSGLVNLNGTLYLTNRTARDQINLWRSDGTPSGTVLAATWTAPPENIVFPADAGILNVKDFGAKGDGITDDTVAIQAALNAFPNGGRIVYLPNGTYLVSNTLSWPAGTPGRGDDFKNTILQGQSQSGVVIRLRDNATGFTSPTTPKSVIFTGPAPAQRFRNSVRNLTVDTGVGNAGAIGIQFNASNQGTLSDVTIRSGDGQGIHGLDMNFADEIGPLLVKNVTVNGFQYGVRTGLTVNSQTFENLTLQNQQVYGFYNTGQIINIRGLNSTNAVTAVYNAGGRMTILDSSFTGTTGAATRPAIQSNFPQDLLVRNVTTSGYQAAIQNATNTLAGPDITEFVSGTTTNLFPSPPRTLNLPIRETPNVPWDDPIAMPWTNVVSFGAIPNDGIDDTAAIQAAIDSGGTTVYFPVGVYTVQGTVLVRNNVRRVIGTEANVIVGSTTNTTSPGFRLVDGTSPVVVFERFQSGFFPNPTFENASSRTIVIRNSLNVSGIMTGTGNVFLEDVVSNPAQNWVFNRQNVWARQFNVENQGTHIINNGGNLWIFGLKTERGGTLIDTRSGGKTELLGGLAYTTTAAPDDTQNDPMFINNESAISISLGEINYGGGPNYTTYVREIRGGITQNLPGSSLPDYIGSGKQIPLYTGY